ncbi:GIY-YIG nuclease family protein [Mangrovibacillus sp. Mu-81]|uniref:GIY-YIG nuclease family protein n=1 Tax=Mangrovibacillus sp. Mu-81 TaxID=3121478 RepID=UPI002FE44CE5
MNELIVEKKGFSREHLDQVKTVHLNNYPIIYILYNDKKKPSAYIGQTVQAARHLKSHLENSRRKNLNRSILIGHEKFNQSATYIISSLIL